MNDNYYILTFKNTIGAISGESTLKENNIELEVMPTPTVITKSCGLSIRVEEKYITKVKKLVKSEKVMVKRIYVKKDNKYEAVDD
ncbi:DUF3343 domain-containing protein [Clostridium fermenticellae]|uniref:DUF3343 domain-containing protein n=2 Tax=Clostridium fermenticellae TaxID=2068654 RepID=A0A386H6J1_9CLOT|nr:DUF3343 domain-containing protein [Clostridium fermenticellae]